MLSSEDKEIVNDLFEKYPEEGCGLLVNKRGKIVWIPCENVAEDKNEGFVISPSDYIKANLIGDLYAVVHSHPDASCEPSEKDKKTSDFLRIPYIIYSLPEVEKYVYTPKEIRTPLLGREYEFGVNDCWSLVRDYYKTELEIELPMLQFEDDWWEKGLNYFGDLYESFGFEKVETPEKHDGIMFQVMAQVPNHCGVYLGEGLFMHHAVNRLSCRESIYSPLWGKNITGYYRCKQLS